MSETGNEAGPALAWDEERLLAFLDGLGVAWAIHRHPPLHTVAESQRLRGELPGAHVKNMFLKGAKGELWLVTCLEDRRVHIRDLEKTLGARKMSFGKPELLLARLGVAPGAVTPLAMIGARPPASDEKPVHLAMDGALLEAAQVNCHPLHNEATITLAAKDLLRALRHADCAPLILDFDVLEAQAARREAEKGSA
ncbi:MAG: prolyl-tRNA synthetase associated domain-containing protein [Pseudomonadota bacterium]